MTGRPRLLAIIVAASVVAAGSALPSPGASAAPRQLPTLIPGDEWDMATPEEVGLDPDVLGGVALEAAGSNSHCLVVVRHGRLVAEWYWNDTTPTDAHQVFSVTKSFTSALVGVAQRDGALAITQSAADFIPEWAGTEAEAVTIEDLLSMDSGREWTFELDYQEMIGAPDRSEFAVGLDQTAAPDTEWMYNNAASQTLSEVLQAATGVEPADYAEEELFDVIGMEHTDMGVDASGNTAAFFDVTSTCRDLARFGLLYLNDGDWDGTEVIPADYVAASVGQPSQELNAAYGYLWWLNRPGPIVDNVLAPIVAGSSDNTKDGPMIPGAPEDMFWASGLFGQRIQVDPGSETVVVRLGTDELENEILARVVTEAVVDD